MPTARIILYTVLVFVNVAAVIAWIVVSKRRPTRERPTWADGLIGFVTNFLDTFGIGSYAQITALFKLRGRPEDELIPGTLNVGSAVPSFLGSMLFFGAIAVEPVLLASMVISSGIGAWVGAGLVSLVIVVIIYAAVSMLRSARASVPESPVAAEGVR